MNKFYLLRGLTKSAAPATADAAYAEATRRATGLLDNAQGYLGGYLAKYPVGLPTAAAAGLGGVLGYSRSEEDEETGEKKHGLRDALLGASVAGLGTAALSGGYADKIGEFGTKNLLQAGARVGTKANEILDSGDVTPGIRNPYEKAKFLMGGRAVQKILNGMSSRALEDPESLPLMARAIRNSQ